MPKGKQKQKGKQQGDQNFRMKAGQYQLHVLIYYQVFIQQTMSLTTDDKQETIDPIIQVSAFGQKQYTPSRTNVGFQQIFWGQHLFFENDFKTAIQIQNARVLISVFDHNKIISNSLVGSYQLDIPRIYLNEHHSMQHFWIALSNIQQQYNQIKGYMKLSISCTGVYDKTIQFKKEPMKGKGNLDIVLPPHIQRKMYLIRIFVIKGQHIKKTDMIGSVDPYVQAAFNNGKCQTDYKRNQIHPVFNQCLHLPLALPSVSQKLIIRLYDHNGVGSNQLIGTTFVTLAELLKKKQLKPRWFNIYGPQKGADGDMKQVYANYPQMATYYCGSILLGFKINEQDAPKANTSKLQDQYRLNNPVSKRSKLLRFQMQFFSGTNLPKPNSNYKIKVRFGQKELQTPQFKSKNGFCSFNYRLGAVLDYHPDQNLPDLFIYLVEDNDMICFYRVKPDLGKNRKNQLKYYRLTPDKSISKIHDEKAGFLKFSYELTQNYKQTTDIKKPLTSDIAHNSKAGYMIVNLYQARNLTPKDDDGSSDPYIHINYMNQNIKSKIHQDNLNPIFSERLLIKTLVQDPRSTPPLFIQCYDDDTVGSDDYIGSGVVEIQHGIKHNYVIYKNQNKNKYEPTWVQLKCRGRKAGQVLIGVQINTGNTNINPHLTYKCKKHRLKIKALGLRGIKSLGIIPIQRPYIQFNMHNIAKLNDPQTKCQNIITQPKSSGCNANIISIISQSIYLPQDRNLWPNLSVQLFYQCVVKDFVIKGVYQPSLGYFSIDLANYVRGQVKSQDKGKLEKVMDEVTNIFSLGVKKAKKQIAKDNDIKPGFMKLTSKVKKGLVKYIRAALKPQLILLTDTTHINQQQPYKTQFFTFYPKYQKQNDGFFKQIFPKFWKQKSAKYYCVGYDKIQMKAQTNLYKRKKHYRFCLDCQIEDVKSLFGQKPFISIPISRGQRQDPQQSVVQKMFNVFDDSSNEVGFFKANIYIQTQQQSKLTQKTDKDQFDRFFLNTVKMVVYLYVLQGVNLSRKDSDSNSDPYLYVCCGNQQYDFKDEYFEDQPNPKFCKKIKFNVHIPNVSILRIEVWDHDNFLDSDDIIGYCQIDLQNRAFSKPYKQIQNKPIQTAKLKSDKSKLPQGYLKYWVDLIPAQNQQLYKQHQIQLQPSAQFQIRVVIWDVQGVPTNDIQDMSDLYVVCTFNGQQQQTDTHYRTSNGIGSFNWRCIFNVKLPVKQTMIYFKVFDKDLLSSNDFISSGQIDISDQLKNSFQNCRQMVIYHDGQQDMTGVTGYKKIDGKKKYQRFQIQLSNKVDQQKDADEYGNIDISISILPKQIASKKKQAGKGRSQPNQFPKLPEPQGRLQFTLNPLRWISMLCGPKVRYQILCLVCCLLILLIGYSVGYSFIGSVIGNLVTPSSSSTSN